MQSDKIKFASQADPAVLQSLREIATEEGKHFQAVLDEALREYLSRKKGERPRASVMQALMESVDEYDALYRELAK